MISTALRLVRTKMRTAARPTLRQTLQDAWIQDMEIPLLWGRKGSDPSNFYTGLPCIA
jgi:hypothetical protein